MDNKRILEMLAHPECYAGTPEWISMIFRVRRLMEIADEKFKFTKEEIIKELFLDNSGEEVKLQLNEDGLIVVEPYAEYDKDNLYGSIKNCYKDLGIDTTGMILPDVDYKLEEQEEK